MGNEDVSKEIIGAAEMEELSLDDSGNRVSRNFLQGFGGGESEYRAVKEEEEEIELNLALSLGGGFGADKGCKKLVRYSSTGGVLVLPVGRGNSELVSANPLVRTSSLPLESEEQWRKRKELQTLRRMEAKRRRFEKQRNARGDKEEKSGLSSRVVGAEVAMVKGKEILVGSSDSDKQGLAPRGLVESKGGNSSSLSDLENNPWQVSSGEVSTTDFQSLKVVSNQIVGTSVRGTSESKMSASSKKTDTTRARGSSLLEDMPCVFTVGNGPQGRRVEGILYKYGKHEEVRIMCICCGDFHSPVEFIKHAGGIDLDNPLKHIVVNPNSSFF